MKAFETFIESDAFFPVLVLLLVALVIVFMWIILSNKTEVQQRRAKKNIKIDESAKIKIVSDQPAKKVPKKIDEEIEKPSRKEIAIVEEVGAKHSYFKDYFSDKQSDIVDDNKEEVVEPRNEEDIELDKDIDTFYANQESFEEEEDPIKVAENINTDLLDFPDLDTDAFNGIDIESEIINSANEYIKNIMNKKEG
ncbi:MAG: hypothetical protein J1F35_00055 [Erysipelotrichales bacterium]|nr:hypothetical protein [Erysipelotrichales bacterium]